MIVFRVESPTMPEYDALICRSINELSDIEAYIGMYLCLPGEEDSLQPGAQVTITAVEMTEAEWEAVPEFEGF